MKELDEYVKIPRHALESLEEYVKHGRPVGSFLEAVISNDLMEAVGRADYYNMHIIDVYAKWLYNKAPIACHGSRKIYETWIRMKARLQEND